MTEPNQRLNVFLCHASENKSEVKRIYQYLKEDGIDAWLDVEKLVGGQLWSNEIVKSIKAADAVLVFLSPQLLEKTEGFVQEEIRIALETTTEKDKNTIYFIPVRLQECDIPEHMEQFHCIDLHSDEGYRRLLKTLENTANNLDIIFTLDIRKLTGCADFLKQINSKIDNNTLSLNNKPVGNTLTISNDGKSVVLTTHIIKQPDRGCIDDFCEQYIFNVENGINLLRNLMDKGQAEIACRCTHVSDVRTSTDDSPIYKKYSLETGNLTASLLITDGKIEVLNPELNDIQVIEKSDNMDEFY